MRNEVPEESGCALLQNMGHFTPIVIIYQFFVIFKYII